jgi:hypothetical protein
MAKIDVLVGRSLAEARAERGLSFKFVEKLSRTLASETGHPELVVQASRLYNIERGAKLTVAAAYSLATIYGLDLSEITGLYGLGDPASDPASRKICACIRQRDRRNEAPRGDRRRRKVSV